MQSSGPQQQLDMSQRPGPKRSVIAALAMILALIALLSFIISLTIVVLNNFSFLKLPWSPNYLTMIFNTIGTIFGALSVAFAFLRNFFLWASSLVPSEAGLSPSFSEISSYSSISSLPPPAAPKAILQREEAVKEIYEALTQPDI